MQTNPNVKYGEFFANGYTFKGETLRGIPGGFGYLNFFLFKQFFCFEGVVQCVPTNPQEYKLKWSGNGVLYWGNGYQAKADWIDFAKSDMVTVTATMQSENLKMMARDVIYKGPCKDVEDLLRHCKIMNDSLTDNICQAQDLPSRILIAYYNSNNRIVVGYIFNNCNDDGTANVNIATLDSEGDSCLLPVQGTSRLLVLTDQHGKHVYTHKDMLEDYSEADFCDYVDQGKLRGKLQPLYHHSNSSNTKKPGHIRLWQCSKNQPKNNSKTELYELKLVIMSRWTKANSFYPCSFMIGLQFCGTIGVEHNEKEKKHLVANNLWFKK